MCFVLIWKQRAIISLHNINWLVFITKTACVYCAVRTEYLYIQFRVTFVFKEHILDSRRDDNITNKTTELPATECPLNSITKQYHWGRKSPSNQTYKYMLQHLPDSENTYSAFRHWTTRLASSIQFTSNHWITQKLANCITLQFIPLPVPVKDTYLLQCNTVQFVTELPISHRTTQLASLAIHPEDGERRYLRNVRTHLPKLMVSYPRRQPSPPLPSKILSFSRQVSQPTFYRYFSSPVSCLTVNVPLLSPLHEQKITNWCNCHRSPIPVYILFASTSIRTVLFWYKQTGVRECKWT
jgi:hypothetical protein